MVLLGGGAGGIGTIDGIFLMALPFLFIGFVIWLLVVATRRFNRMQEDYRRRDVADVIAKAHAEVERDAKRRDRGRKPD